MPLKRWDGERFVSGGVLRAWTGIDWNPPLLNVVTPDDYDSVAWFSARRSGLGGGPVAVANAGPVNFTAHGSPTFELSALNTLPGIRTSPGSWLTCADPSLDLGANFTVIMVLRTEASNGDGMAWMFGETATQKRRALWCQGQASYNLSGYDSNVISGVGGAGVAIVTITRSAGYVTIRRNGALVGQGAPTLSPYTFTGFGMGANVSGSEPYTGVIGELAMWARALSDLEAAAIEQQWLADYGLA